MQPVLHNKLFFSKLRLYQTKEREELLFEKLITRRRSLPIKRYNKMLCLLLEEWSRSLNKTDPTVLKTPPLCSTLVNVIN